MFLQYSDGLIKSLFFKHDSYFSAGYQIKFFH